MLTVAKERNPKTIGLISDTHGLLRPQALRALEGSDLIIHAGDVGNPEILETLKTLAPVFAVRGNVDTDPWALALPETEVIETTPQRFTFCTTFTRSISIPSPRDSISS